MKGVQLTEAFFVQRENGDGGAKDEGVAVAKEDVPDARGDIERQGFGEDGEEPVESKTIRFDGHGEKVRAQLGQVMIEQLIEELEVLLDVVEPIEGLKVGTIEEIGEANERIEQVEI